MKESEGQRVSLHFPIRSTVVPLADAAMEPRELWSFPIVNGKADFRSRVTRQMIMQKQAGCNKLVVKFQISQWYFGTNQSSAQVTQRTRWEEKFEAERMGSVVCTSDSVPCPPRPCWRTLTSCRAETLESLRTFVPGWVLSTILQFN